MTRMTRFAVTFIVTAGELLAARGANAQATDAGTPTCASLTNPVYVDGSSAFVPTAGAFAVKLASSTANKMTIVYTSPGSCSGVNDIATNKDLTGTGTYFSLNTTGGLVKNSCTLPASGQKADLAISDVFKNKGEDIIVGTGVGITPRVNVFLASSTVFVGAIPDTVGDNSGVRVRAGDQDATTGVRPIFIAPLFAPVGAAETRLDPSGFMNPDSPKGAGVTDTDSLFPL